MDLIDEQHIVFIEIGQDRSKITSPLNSRSRRDPDIDAHFIGNDPRQRCLSQSRRAVKQHVIQRFLSQFGRLNKYF